MNNLLTISWHSLLSRKKTVILTFFSLCISVMVLLGIEHIRIQAKESFNRSISGVDLLVGAPSGQLNILLYSIFRMGSPTNNIEYESFEMLQKHQQVNWAIPISLGDSHRGFRVMGTNEDYFKHYKYGNKTNLTFYQGAQFTGLFETVIGADVAEKLGYKVQDRITISHGIGSTSFTHHDQAPFVISGILDRTGTPVDKTIHVSLEAIEAIHMSPNILKTIVQNPNQISLTPKSITAVILGLNSKMATFTIQRNLNNYSKDRLMAVLPGVAMAELWSLMSTVENLLRAISGLVLISALFGLSTMLLASMNERKNEIAVLRVLGAGPATILLLILIEALILVVLSLAIGLAGIKLLLIVLESWLASEYGLFLSKNIISIEILVLSGLVIISGIVVSIFPGLEAYKSALHAQLSGK